MGRTDFIKKIVDALQLDVNLEKTPYAVGSTFVPVISLKIPPKIVIFRPTEAEFVAGFIVPAGKRWRVLLAQIGWNSDGNAGNREIVLEIWDNIDKVIRFASPNYQIASKSVNYSFFGGAPNIGSPSGLIQSISIPEKLLLTQGDGLSVYDYTGVAVGDTVSSAILVVEEEDVFPGEVEER